MMRSGIPTTKAEDSGHTGGWSYDGPTGPGRWGDLQDEYAACKEGRRQSPIDLAGSRRGPLPPLQFDYAATPLAIANNGHSIQVNYAPGSTLTVARQRYELLQFHFHAPSEHTVGGRSFGMEAHLVHRDGQGQLAVVGILLQAGAANAFLQPIWQHMPRVYGITQAGDAPVNVAEFLPTDQSYYTYAGSLTTPPCTEGVSWYVLRTPVEASTDQITQFAALFPPHNARPVQARNQRTIRASA